MSAFVASGPVDSGHINTDPFWPSIDLDHLRATLRIDANVTPARLETAVIAAVVNLNSRTGRMADHPARCRLLHAGRSTR